MANSQQGYFVLENSKNEVVRVFNLSSNRVQLVKIKDTKRVQLVASTKVLSDEGIEFEELSPVLTKSDITRLGYTVQGLGSIKYVKGFSKTSPVYQFQQENAGQFNLLLRWTSIVHVALILLILTSSAVVDWIKDEPEPIVVKVFKQKEVQKVIKRRVVKATKYKPKKVRNTRVYKAKKKVKKTKRRRIVAKKAVKRRSTIVKNTRRNVKPQAKRRSKTRKRSLGQMGALGVLGGKNSNARGRSGLDIGRLRAGGVAGLGRGARSGTSRAVYNKGLVAVRSGGGIGSGSGARGGGAYNTRGKGGGRNGYGKQDLSGIAAAFSRPVTSEAIIEGGLSRSQIAAVIEKHMGEIVYCYEKGLQKNPKLGGRVGMRFVIGGRGRVTTAKVARSSLRSSSVESCMVRRLKSWKFPKPRGNVDVKVSYPFVLRRMNQG